MTGNSNKKDSPIELNELLKLKRHEQPDDAFWEKFDKELHEKTLQSVVKRKAWYSGLFQSLEGRLQSAIPLSATAILLLGLMLNQYSALFLSEKSDSVQPKAVVAEAEIVDENVIIIEADEALLETIEKPDTNFVVGTYYATRESNLNFIKVPVSKSMPSVNPSHVHFVAGNFKKNVAAASSVSRLSAY